MHFISLVFGNGINLSTTKPYEWRNGGGQWMDDFLSGEKSKKKRVTQRWLLKITDLFLEKHWKCGHSFYLEKFDTFSQRKANSVETAVHEKIEKTSEPSLGY